MIRVLIVIVNYRTGDLIIDCLTSLAPEIAALPGARVIITDNASGDGSPARVLSAVQASGWGSWAAVMPLERNGGFSCGNNAAIRPALASPDPPGLVLLLNPDTLVRPGALVALVEFMASHPRAGIAGSRIEDPDGTPHGAAHWLPTPLTELDAGARLGAVTRLLGRHAVTCPQQPGAHPCGWVSGASLMIRREVFAEIGLLDEGYFLYFDEVDFCRRTVLAGWEVWHVPASRIVHLEGAATGITNVRKRRGSYWYDSRRRFYVKAYGVAGLIAADLLWGLGRLLLLRRLVGLGGTTRGDPKRLVIDLLWGDLRSILTGKVWSIDRRARPS